MIDSIDVPASLGAQFYLSCSLWGGTVHREKQVCDHVIKYGHPMLATCLSRNPTACPISHPPRLLTLISGNLSHALNAICPSRRVRQPPRKSRFGLLNADMLYATCI
jgi:hypothetical protein